jgi:hypothetical protein
MFSSVNDFTKENIRNDVTVGRTTTLSNKLRSATLTNAHVNYYNNEFLVSYFGKNFEKK